MAGGRERLAKAVVYEAVRSAHAQGRPCLVYAFSGASDLAELRLVPRRQPRHAGARERVADRRSLTRLLDFLACGFGGGTDVAGPLRRALDVLDRPGRDDVAYSGADRLLVSDGELPDPPLDAATHARLRSLQRSRGFEVHGLLVGTPRPTPLDQICDEVHTCLSRFDPLAIMRETTAKTAAAAAERADGRRATGTRAARTAALQMCVGEATDAPGEEGSDCAVLRAAAATLERGLVEREGEARLLLLALAAGRRS